MIRAAKPGDIGAVVDLAVESVSINPIPVIIDRDAMREQALECTAPQNYLRVFDRDGTVIGAWAAVTHPSFWHERRVSSVLLHYAREPGVWARLARDYFKWVEGRGAIRVAVMELEPESDPRMVALLNRIGFARVSTQVSYVRGM